MFSILLSLHLGYMMIFTCRLSFLHLGSTVKCATCVIHMWYWVCIAYTRNKCVEQMYYRCIAYRSLWMYYICDNLAMIMISFILSFLHLGCMMPFALSFVHIARWLHDAISPPYLHLDYKIFTVFSTWAYLCCIKFNNLRFWLIHSHVE